METPSTNGNGGLPARRAAFGAQHCTTAESEGIKETAVLADRRLSKTLALEPELRADSHAEIVMCAIVEEHVVSRFQSQANGAGEGFDTSRGIECEVSSPAAESNRIRKPGWSIGSGHAKVVESHLAGNERAECAGTGLEFGSEEAMERPQAGGHR